MTTVKCCYTSAIKNRLEIQKLLDALQGTKDADLPIKAISLDELRETKLRKGGNVIWVDRGCTSVRLLKKHGKIVITGRMKLGKTREAIELIQKMVDEGWVSKDRIFEPGVVYLFNREKLKELLQRGVDPKAPVLLFIDDITYHYFGEGLERLADLIQGLSICQEFNIVATARSDQLNDSQEHQEWLKNKQFHEVTLPDMSGEQIGRVVDAAAGVFGVQIDDATRQAFINLGDGRPELPIFALQRKAAQGQTSIQGDEGVILARESLEEQWESARRYIYSRKPASKYLFQALGAFHAARVMPFTYFVIAYAAELSKQDHKGRKLASQIKRQISDSLKYLGNFDINERGKFLRYPDVAVENLIDEDTARDELGKFLLEYCKNYARPLTSKLYTQAEMHFRLLLGLALGYFFKKQYQQAIIIIGQLLAFYPRNAKIYSLRGITHAALQDYPAALTDYVKAIEIDPKDAALVYNTACVYGLQLDAIKACEWLRRAIEMDRKSYEAAKTDTDFDGIRETEEFKKLMKELAG